MPNHTYAIIAVGPTCQECSLLVPSDYAPENMTPISGICRGFKDKETQCYITVAPENIKSCLPECLVSQRTAQHFLKVLEGR